MNASAGAPRWVRTTAASVRGVVVAVHGLNFKASGMQTIANMLTNQGHDILLVSLKGHDGDIDEMKKVRRADWLTQMHEAYDLANARAQETQAPLKFVGASLGAQLGVELMNEPSAKARTVYAKAMLFAPALTVRDRSQIVRWLFGMSDDILIPSLCPPEYRANDGTPIAAYRALFEGFKAIESNLKPETGDIPTTVFLDPEDELVSLPGLKELLQSRGFKHWTIIQVSNRHSVFRKPYHHLITDPRVLGEKEWATKVQPLLEVF